MVMRTYVSTLGFHETRVTRPVLRHGLDDTDAVVLLRPETETASDRAAEAVDYVEDMLVEIAPDASIAVERIDTNDFPAAVKQCSAVLLDADGELIVNFGGGAREVFLPFAIATILHAPLVDTAIQYTDVGQDIRDVPIPDLTASVPPKTEATLAEITQLSDEISIPELAAASDKSKSTVTRHVNQLAENGVITTWMEGKTKHARLSFTGELIFRARQTRGKSRETIY